MRRLSDRAGGVAPILFKRLRSLIQEGTPFELPRQPFFAASAGRNAVTEPDDKKEELLAAEDDLLSRDPEVANRALERISQIFEDQEDRGKVSGNDPEEPDAAALDLTAETELTDVLSDLHPADIAYILEALPPEQRLAVWNLVRHEHEGDVLICGYGFTAEPDYLYQINRNTGEIIDRLLLKKMPDLIVEQDGKLYVHTYSYNYVIEIE